MAGSRELLGGFGIEPPDEFGGVLEVGKQHDHLLAFAFEGTAGRRDLLGEVGRGVGEGHAGQGLPGSRRGGGSGASVTIQTKPRPASSRTSG